MMHYDDLFDLDLSSEEVVKGVLDGQFRVDGYTDNLALAEDYIQDIEEMFVGEDTTKLWKLIREEEVL